MMWYLAACKIWKLVGVNDMNYDADRSNDIYSCFQADKYMYKHFKHYDRAFRILGKY